MTRPQWHRVKNVRLDGPEGGFLSDAFRRTDDQPLIVTPNSLGSGYKITHAESGHCLWPNTWTLRQAKQICDDLLRLDGWARPFPTVVSDEKLRTAAERIARPSERGTRWSHQ